jgi:hypothetical protein
MTRSLLAFLIALLLVGYAPIGTYAQSDALLPVGSEWRYNDKGEDLGVAWREPGFDDSAWKRGKAPLGYGVDDIKAALSFGNDPNQKRPTYYFRTSFTVADPTVLPNMLMKIRYDDGFIAYLNGREIARGSFPPGREISFATLADEHVDKGQRLLFETFNLTSQRSAFVAGKNVLAVEVHQHSPTSTDMVLDVSLELATSRTAPQIMIGPALGQMRRDSAHILVAGDGPTLATVQYGPTAAFGTEQRTHTETVVHDFILGGLKPGATYYYRVGLAAATDQTPTWSDTRSFRTDGGPGTAFRFGVWAGGATSGDAKQLSSAIDKLSVNQPLNLAIAIGTVGSSSAPSAPDAVGSYTQYYSALKSFVGAVPLYSSLPADVGQGCDVCLSAFQNYLPNPAVNGGRYYSFDYGDAHFVILNSSDRADISVQAGLGPEQWEWLSNDLVTKRHPYTFIFMEHPLFGATGSGNYTDEQRDALHQLFKAAKVTAVFAGADTYGYQEHDGLAYISTSDLLRPSATQTNNQMLMVDVQPAEVKLTSLAVSDGRAVEEHVLAQQSGVAPIATPEPAAAAGAANVTVAPSGPNMPLIVLFVILGLVGGTAGAWVYWRRTHW